jgi:uncharacterized glyoxalase superfamily protein PhnB
MLAPILACSDVESAILYYTRSLGFELAWEMPPGVSGKTEFASVRLGDAEILLGIIEGFVHPADLDKRGTGVQLYVSLPDAIHVDALYTHMQQNGALITREIETREWGERAFNVRDIDGYHLMFAQQTVNP